MDIAPARPGDVDAVTRLVNEAYAAGEEGLWVAGTARTDAAEVASIVTAGELVVARDDSRIAGVVRVRRLAGGEGEFGMLATADRGAGVGRDLVAYAEKWARDAGLGIMQLELLVPRTWRHPVKEVLRGWYTRLGYRVVRTGDFAGAYPMLESRLATPCDFLVFHKALYTA